MMSNFSYFYVNPIAFLSDGDIACMSGDEFKKYWFNLLWAWKRGDGFTVQPYLDKNLISISQINPVSHKRSRKPFSQALRNQILERDGHECVWCESTKKLEIDHIIPYSLVHEHNPENLQVLCQSCNQIKGARYDG